MRKRKLERQKRMRELLREQPFLTDEELARRLQCSIQTIRLDRVEMSIPEVRERIRKTAIELRNDIRAIAGRELTGELIDLDLEKSALSIMTVSEAMISVHAGVARAQHLFAQANTLALAVIDAPAAVTGVANIKFKSPVYRGEKVVAKAEVMKIRGDKYSILVRSRVNTTEVFRGKFLLVRRTGGGEKGDWER
ncbi:MAG: transcription factor FapR [Negativicutes bacterium]|nr:transcription factor FapR [Negativicutes bacterium]